MKRFKAWAGIALIFLFGVFCGVSLATGVAREKLRRLVEGGPDKVVDEVVSRMRSDLHLDSQQGEMLQHIVVETHIKLSGIRQKTQPEVDEVLHEAEQKVRGILNEKQTAKFDQIVHKGRERWQSKLATPAPAP